MIDIINFIRIEDHGRLFYIFFMCVLLRSIKTIQNITQITGQKFATAILIAAETVFFLLVFKNLLMEELTVIIIISTIILGYILGFYIGLYLEEKLALGKVKVSIKISKDMSKDLFRTLNDNGFIFVRSRRYYSHNDKPRKFYSGVIYRKELGKLKHITKDFNAVFVIENIKDTFGKKMLYSKDYLKLKEV